MSRGTRAWVRRPWFSPVRSNASALVRARCAAQTVTRWPATLLSAGKPVPQVDGGRLRPQTMPAGGCLAVAADREQRDQVALGDQGERVPVSYTHLRAHETPEHLVCRLLLEKKKK